MHLKSRIQELRDGLGSISRRSFDVKVVYRHYRSRSMSSVLDVGQEERASRETVVPQQSRWANMPPELLRDILQGVESSEDTWPSRKHLVACACVCRNWREIVKELVRPPEHSIKITFPISLKQPGPRSNTIQCFIKRDRSTCTYLLYLEHGATLVESGKFLLAARKVRRATSTDYIISLSADDMSRGSNTYVGKLRSNFLGTKFTIFDSQPPRSGVIDASSNKGGGRRVGSQQVCPRVPAGSYNIANIAYELNVLGTRGPRRMHCTMHSIPASAMEPGGMAPTPVEFSSAALDYSLFSLPYFGSKSSISDYSSADVELLRSGAEKEAPLTLKNKAPRWHEQLQCWCLNFRGRVTVASVKNFQLVVATELPEPPAPSDYDKVLLQFGKVGKDMFTMDYRYPLSAFQAFAICLSSFDTKLACE